MNKLTNEEIEQRLRGLVRSERFITIEVLETILVAEDRRIYAERGYPNLLKWLVESYGYSQSAAQRRIEASRFLRVFPESREAIITGFLNLSCISLMQSTFRKQEKLSGERVSIDEKRATVSLIYGKNCDEARAILAERFPDVEPSNESLRPVNGKQSKLTVILDESHMASLRRAKELLSHSCDGWSETVGALAEEYAKRKDPLKKSASDSASEARAGGAGSRNEACDDEVPRPQQNDLEMTHQFTAAEKHLITKGHRYIPAATRRLVIQRDSAKCVYTDPIDSYQCGSSDKVQVDHIVSLFEGGSNDVTNLRCLCRTHNLLAARQRLGRIMDKYSKTLR